MGNEAGEKGEKELCILSEVYVTLGLEKNIIVSNIIACIRILFHLSCKNGQLKNLHGVEAACKQHLNSNIIMTSDGGALWVWRNVRSMMKLLR